MPWPVLALLALAPTLAAQEIEPETTIPATETADELISLDVLEAQLRPLTRDQVQAELDGWLGVLQVECIRVSEVEIQALGLDDSDDAEAIQRVNELAVELRAERSHLIARVNAVIASLEEKGGDVTEARAYIESVIVTPPVTGWRAAWTTIRAWVSSAEGGVALGKDVGKGVAVLIAAWLIAGLLGSVVKGLLGRTNKVSKLLRTFAAMAVRRTLLFFGLLVALSQLGLNMTPMLAAIGALGLVVGLALQGTLSNFASGLMIMVYRPFDVGDVVSAAGTVGTVEGMTLVTTAIKTFDNQRLSIPNNMIWDGVITNITAEGTRRVDMTFGIGYADDVGQAKEVLMDILTAHEKVLSDPEPIVKVSELADSSVNFIVRPWVKTEDYWDVLWEVTQLVKERFDAEGISIPFPQRDMHVYHEAAAGPDGTQRPEGEAWIQPQSARTHEPAPAGEEGTD